MVHRKLGQHFLTDDGVVQREIEYAELSQQDVVLEIGAGTGVLTQQLALKAKQVIAIEIDRSLVQQLQHVLPKNVTLISGDALEIDFTTLPACTKIVANLPFQISSPITFKLLDLPFTKAILIYQKDFAERMIAQPRTKDYSRLSVGIYYKTHCRVLEIVPRTCFSPQPKVDACIVELIPRKNPPFSVPDESFFFTITKELFNHRRKKIKNTLEKKFLQMPSFLYGEKRVEELTPEQIGELCIELWDASH